jgi:hypothetical protein
MAAASRIPDEHHGGTGFGDEDTDVAPEPRPRRESAEEAAPPPTCELMWVEEEGSGMVLQVRPRAPA